MSRYVINASNDLQASHRYMLGLPLVAAGLFCFSFIFMHTHNTSSTVVNTRAVKTENVTPTASDLSTPNLTQTPANQVTTQPDNLSSTSPKSTSKLQSAGNSTSLQQAVPNHQSDNETGNELPIIRHHLNKPRLIQPLNKLLKSSRD